MQVRSWKQRGIALGSLGAFLVLSSPALAQNAWFKCDGYGAANRNGDGMINYALAMGLFVSPQNGTTVRRPNALGQEGIAGCDEALQELPQAHWRRKVNLLQARALHKLEARQFDSALIDLDQAQAAAAPGQTDPLFQRSQQLGLAVVRAVAFQHKQANDEARNLLSLAARERPYDLGTLSAVHNVAALGGYDDLTQSVMLQTARLQPQGRTPLALQDFDQGRFDNFLALRPHLSPLLRAGDNSLLPVEAALRDLANYETSIRFDVYIGLYRAYALAAVGRHDEADRVMAETGAAQKAIRQPPAPSRLRGPAQEQYNEELAHALARLERQDAAVSDMARVISHRRQAGEGQITHLADLFGSEAIRRDGTGADILTAAAEFFSPEEAEQARKMAAELRAELARGALTAPRFNTNLLLDSLPAPEAPKRLSPWSEAKRPFLSVAGSYDDMSAVGYRDQRAEDGLVTVRYRSSTTGTQAITEEMALLRAAELARQSGYDGFFIVARRGTAWTSNTAHLGTIIRSDPDGYESELDIRFVNTGTTEVPEFLVFNANKIYADLAPVYMRSE